MILVLFGLAISVLLMTVGLAVDVGWWYTLQRRNQSAADAAALAGAYEVVYGRSSVATYLTPAASAAATTMNSYGGTTPVITYNSGTGQVQADLQQTPSTWFASLAGLTNVTVATRAIAQITTLPAACILALNPTASNAINVAGNASINAPDCTLVSDSNSTSAFHFQGSVSITAATLITPGEVSTTGSAYSLTLTSPPQTGAQSVPDPYASTLTHANLINGMPTTTNCTYNNASKTWSGNCKVSGSSIKVGDTLSATTQIVGGLGIKNGTVNLSPGVYWVTDGDLALQNSKGVLSCSSCSNGGAGVTIILTTAKPSGGTVGALTLGAQADLTLNAPSSQTATGFNNSGMVLIQDSNGLPAGTTINTSSTAQGNAAETLSGLVYFPKSALSFQGTPVASGPQCLVVVANTLSLQGNPGLGTTGCQGATGLGLSLQQPKTVVLIQ